MKLRYVLPAVAALAALAFFLRRSPPGRPSSPEPPAPKPAESRPPPPPPAAPEPRDLRKLANDLRRRALEDKDFRRQLIARLADPSEPLHLREVAAFVLASLDDPEAERALVRALEAGGESRWVRALVLALGSARDGRRPNPFDVPETPYRETTPHGLSVVLSAILLDRAARGALERQLEHADPEVRRAVLLSLRRTLVEEPAEEVEDTRRAFVRTLEADRDPSLRARAGGALGEWLLKAPPSYPKHAEVVDALVRRSLDPAEGELRFQASAALQQTRVPDSRLDPVVDQALTAADFDLRAWAIDLAAAQAETIGPGRAKLLLDAGMRDADPKVRELTLHRLSRLARPEEGVAVAAASLRDPAWHVRHAAVRALAGYPAGAGRLAALEEAARSDPHEEVRSAARAALKR